MGTSIFCMQLRRERSPRCSKSATANPQWRAARAGDGMGKPSTERCGEATTFSLTSPTMPSLSESFAALAQTFAQDVLALARKASVDDIIAETNAAPVKRGPGRPPKSSSTVDVSALPTTARRMGPAMIDSVASLITRYVKSHPGARAEVIRKKLGLPKNKWAVPLALALSTKGLSKKGEKRATTYWVK